MTREDEIRSAASDHRDWVCCGFIDFVADAQSDSFAKGAKWADKTMIDKACEWLRANIDLYADTRRSLFSNYQEVYLTDNFETEFHKAMKETV